MAEQEPAAKGNGDGGNGNGAGPGADEAQVQVMAQYVKDLSVENPSAPQVFQWQGQPSLDVQFSLNADKIADDVHEVMLKIEVSARSDNGVHFVIDLTYAGLFAIRGVPEEAIPPFLLIEAPRLLFPFARQIVAEAVTNTGFPPFMLEPIDFASIYMAQVQQLQEQGGEQGGEPGDEPAAKDG
jgi:preprotein translocase subunit SecB